MGSITNVVIAGPANVQAVWRHRKEISAEHGFIQVLQRVLGVPTADGITLEAERSVQGLMSSWRATRKTAGKGVWQQVHRMMAEQLTNMKAANVLTGIFVQEWGKQLASLPCDGTPVSIIDLFKDQCFKASAITLSGGKLLELDPDFGKEFWFFDEYFNVFLFGLPKVFAKDVYEARERILSTTERWLEDAERNIDWENVESENPYWEPNFGHRVPREMFKLLRRGGISKRGVAALELAMVWA
jgi:hypothetical protein